MTRIVSQGKVSLILVVVLMITLTPLYGYSAGTNDSEEVESDYRKGVRKVEQQSYSEAESLFLQSIDEGRKVAESYNMLGYVRRKQGKYRNAMQAYYKALDRKQDFPEAREYLGEAYLMAAREQLDQIRENYGTEHEAYRELETAFVTLAKKLRVETKNGSTSTSEPSGTE